MPGRGAVTGVAPRSLVLMVVLGLLAAAGCTGPSRPKPVRPGTPPQVSWWLPKVGTTWQWQLKGRIDTSVPASVYDVDLFDVDRAVVEELHRKGRKVICYINVGAYEPWRPDASRFPADVLGEELDGWPGERWLDIRRIDVLEPIMAARMNMCRAKGFDAVEPDNVDGYANDSGFPLEDTEQLHFNRMVARLAHDRGLGVALKNDLDQVEDLVGDFDFAVNEECVAHKECQELVPFILDGKAVLHAEYSLPLSDICPVTESLHFSSIRKPLNLTAPREPCP
jgi:hypothetical protein